MRAVLLLAAVLFAGCASKGLVRTPSGQAPSALLGEFSDDYEIGYSISNNVWYQHPGSRYNVVAWHQEEQYLIAQNDDANPVDGGLWTRIDWMQLPDMPPYTWAFCLSAYKAGSAEEAEASETAERGNPRIGCNGFPFSRMRTKAEEG